MKEMIKVNLSKTEIEYIRDLIWKDYKDSKDKKIKQAMMIDGIVEELDMILEDLYEDEWTGKL